MMIIKLGIISIILCLLLLLFCWLMLTKYYEEKNRKIKFSSFLSLYKIAPYKWSLNNNSVTYTTWGNHYINEEFGFNLIDQIRYRIFTRKVKNEKERKADMKKMEFLIRNWQEDIDNYKEHVRRELERMNTDLEGKQ